MLTPSDGLEWIGSDAWDSTCGFVDARCGTSDYVTPADEMAWESDENASVWNSEFAYALVEHALKALRARRNL